MGIEMKKAGKTEGQRHDREEMKDERLTIN